MATVGLRCCPSIAAGFSRRHGSRSRAVCAVMSTSSGTDAGSASSISRGSCNSTSVRILRYPDGNERHILYPEGPVPTPEIEVDTEEFSWSLWTQTDEDESMVWNECDLLGASCTVTDPDPLAEELASLHKKLQPANVNDMVRGSYQILTGSPWLMSRPLFVLAQQSVTSDQGTLYCLQTRINQEGAMDELAMVLKRPSLASQLSSSRMKDGVLAFDRAEDAARYATCLEADLPGEVAVMEVDSMQLFLLTGDSAAVVVYLPWSEFMPLPHQLAAALRAGDSSSSSA